MKKCLLQPDASSAMQAKFDALKISFAPITFQVTYAVLKLGILKLIDECGEQGISAQDVGKKLNISLYGTKVLLDAALSYKLVWLNDDRYVLDKVGYFVLSDSMIHTNLDFVQDVCYQGLFYLINSIKNSSPEGLKTLGDWKTIYPALHTLPEPAKTSWFQFDHYYSDQTFTKVLSIIFSKPVNHIFDIGGNTGKFALQCLDFNPSVKITIIDLPEQIANLKSAQNKIGLDYDRCTGFDIDLLDPNAQLPKGADVTFMSQFLDCFSEAEILSILQRTATIMDANTRLYILDLFWDRQEYDAATYSLNCISIYFTCMANGNSRMYHSKDLIKLIHKAGLYVDEDMDHIGTYHTLLCCKTKP
jgi:hypothetical protein